MNKTCARCEKTVYPTEELKCLDKVWHKGCFKCQECGMTLNMRTYKGYGKLPYCEAHVPKAKHTTIAETPELKRIAENTKLQSNVKYHADFEKSKGKFTQVADDPEMLRIKANTRIISNVAYHGDLEKKAQMEKQRTLNENGELVDPPPDNYQQQLDNYATEMLQPPTAQQAPALPSKNQHYQAPSNQNAQDNQYRQDHYQRDYQPAQNYQHTQNYQTSQSYQPAQSYQQSAQNYQQPAQNYQQPAQNYQPPQNYQNAQKDYFTYGQYYNTQHNHQTQQKIGKIQDYDPLSDGPRAPPEMRQPAATLVYNSGQDGKRGFVGAGQSSQHQQQNRPIGRVADLDPLAGDHRSQHRAPLPAANTAVNGRVYVAMYDYDANDSDEVSFREGDLISNVSSIDEGWMTGQVVRTGRTGMLPANYVELARI